MMYCADIPLMGVSFGDGVLLVGMSLGGGVLLVGVSLGRGPLLVGHSIQFTVKFTTYVHGNEALNSNVAAQDETTHLKVTYKPACSSQ